MVEKMVPLKDLSNFQKTIEMCLIYCEIKLGLTYVCYLMIQKQATTFTITDTKIYVPVVTLSTQDNAKLFQQLKSGFSRTINWNKYQSKVSSNCKDKVL